MSKIERRYARYTRQATMMFGRLIRVTRIEKGMTASELAERVNISRASLLRLEKGDPGCSIGVCFEAAFVLGIPLFHSTMGDLMLHNHMLREKLTLLPSTVHAKAMKADDDF